MGILLCGTAVSGTIVVQVREALAGLEDTSSTLSSSSTRSRQNQTMVCISQGLRNLNLVPATPQQNALLLSANRTNQLSPPPFPLPLSPPTPHLIVSLLEVCERLGSPFKGGRDITGNDQDILVSLAKLPGTVSLPAFPRLYPVGWRGRGWVRLGSAVRGAEVDTRTA